MVFGWGKKKEEKHQEVSEKKEISVKEIPKIVDGILSLRTTQMLSEIKSIRNDTEPLIKELVKIGQNLEKDSLDVDDIDKHLRIIVVRGKKQVIEVIKKDASNLPKVSAFEDAKNLDDTLNQMLKKIGDVLGRQTRVIHIFAKKYADQLKEILAQMNSNHSEIRKLIKNHEETKFYSDKIINLIKTINAYESEIAHNKERISELKTNIKSLENQITLLNNSIEKVTASKEYVEYQSLKDSLNLLDSEKHDIKNQIRSQLTKISRPLNRYEYVSSDKEQKNLLVQLIEDPLEAFCPKNRDLIIVILENVRKGILSGSISVKDVDKSMTQITETVELIDSFIKQIDGFKKKIQSIKNKMNEFDTNTINKLQNNLEKTLDEKEEHDIKITTFENEINQTRSKIPTLLSEIESKLRNFSSVQYTLVKPASY
jgi:chromosome segregation ATPase